MARAREWQQLHGYYLTRESADAALATRKNSAWERSYYAPEDRPTYRLRSRVAGPRGSMVEGRKLWPGEKFYWIERGV